MSQADVGKPPRSVVSIYPPLVILAVALGLGVWAQAYSDVARRFPTVVAVLLAALAMIDLWSRLPLPGQRFISAFWGTSFDRREMMVVPPLVAELRLLAWVLLAFGVMAVVGILPALPTFCFLFVWLRAGRSVWQAVQVALVLLVFEYLVFEWLLDYELYRGLLFSKGGLARW